MGMPNGAAVPLFTSRVSDAVVDAVRRWSGLVRMFEVGMHGVRESQCVEALGVGINLRARTYLVHIGYETCRLGPRSWAAPLFCSRRSGAALSFC